MSKTPPPPPRKKSAIVTPTVTPTVIDPWNTVHPWDPFSIDGIDVQLFRRGGDRDPNVPSVDEHYCFREDLVRELAWAVWPHDDGLPTPCLIPGPKGCGKTSLVLQVAARCNIPVFRINLNVGTTTRHLKGRVGVAGGETTFIKGIATQAMEEGAWLLLDEVSGATPPVALSLFPILEPDGAVYLEDEQPPRYVHRHPDFRVFATDNTIGADQEEARFQYSGTNPEVNIALLDRFGSTIQVGYLDDADEFDTVSKKVPALDLDVLEGMIRVATDVRASNALASGFSTRMVVDWARRVAAGRVAASGQRTPYETDQAVLDLAFPAFLNKLRSRVERDAVVEIICEHFEDVTVGEPK